MTMMGTSLLVPATTNPRRHRDDARMRELVASVKEKGVLVPLLVFPMPDGKRMQIVAGSRRYEAAQAAGLKQVPVRVLEGDLSEQDLRAVQIIENLQREDVHPLDEALGFQALLEQRGGDLDRVATEVAKSKTYIVQRIKLADLILPIQKTFLAGRLTLGHAQRLARLQPKDQEEATKFVVDRRGTIGTEDLDDWIERNVLLDLHSAPWKKDDADLVPTAGPCTTCPKRTGNAPQLFPDIAKKDTCTDPTCFAAKMAAHIARATAELAKDGKALRLSTAYDYAAKTKPRDPLPEPAWTEAKPKSCKYVERGIVVDGGNSYRRVGQILSICREGKCKVHFGRFEGMSESPQAAAKRKARQKQERAETAIRTKLLDATIAAVHKPLSRLELETVAWRTYDRLEHEQAKRIALRHGLTPRSTSWGGKDYDKPVREMLSKASEDALAQFLIECALFGETLLNTYGYGASRKPVYLLALAKARRVKIASVRRQVQTELTTKSKRGQTTKTKRG